jgi:hypothetical protein
MSMINSPGMELEKSILDRTEKCDFEFYTYVILHNKCDSKMSAVTGTSTDKKDQLVTQWLRPYDISMSEDKHLDWAVFRNPLPTDISQGNN